MLLVPILALAVGVQAVVKPSLLFSDNAVFLSSPTRGSTVWGEAAPGETVKLDGAPQGRVYTTTAGADGRWNITLAPFDATTAAGNNTFTMTLSGSDTSPPLSAVNVSFGEVFLCSGQSNMALTVTPLYDNVSIIDGANHPELRLFKVQDKAAPEPQTDLPIGSTWVQTTPRNILPFSGLCYLSVLQLERIRGGPSGRVYGLIEAAIGSTDIQSWLSSDQRQHAADTCWTPKGGDLPPSNSKQPVNGTAASELWNAMVAPLVPFPFTALLWDQGENNAHYCTRSQYNCLLNTLVTSWRRVFQSDEAPAVFVQLGGYFNGAPASTDANLNFSVAAIRAAITDTLPPGPVAYSNTTRFAAVRTGFAASYDLGSPEYGDPANHWWIHCRNKTEVGRRVARQLLPYLEPSNTSLPQAWGPVVESTSLAHDPSGVPYAVVTFSHANGLRLGPAQGCITCCDQLHPRNPDQHLFMVANAKGKWFPAQATVLTQYPPAVAVRPVNVTVAGNWLSSVRFGMLDVPQCALYNSDELPAGPFEFPVGYSSKRQ